MLLIFVYYRTFNFVVLYYMLLVFKYSYYFFAINLFFMFVDFVYCNYSIYWKVIVQIPCQNWILIFASFMCNSFKSLLPLIRPS